jgi:hypothetical protein
MRVKASHDIKKYHNSIVTKKSNKMKTYAVTQTYR